MSTRQGYRWFRGTWAPSSAQQRVLAELAAGYTNAEIAARLGLSSETVKSHIARLLGETGCADRQALTDWWHARSDRRPTLSPLAWLLARSRIAVAATVAVALGVLLWVAGSSGLGRVVTALPRRPEPLLVGLPPDTPSPSLP